MTDRQTDGRTDARGKTICLPTLSGGDIKMSHARFCHVDMHIKFGHILYRSLYTAIRPCGHSRQGCTRSVSIRQFKRKKI